MIFWSEPKLSISSTFAPRLAAFWFTATYQFMYDVAGSLEPFFAQDNVFFVPTFCVASLEVILVEPLNIAEAVL